MRPDALERNSVEYAELLAEVFSEIVRKGADGKRATGAVEEDVTHALMQCLEYIYLHGPSSIRRIADGLSISVPAVSQLVDRLAHRGLVNRHEGEEDRRLTHVDLNAEGRTIVERARSARGEWFRSLCDKLPENRRLALVDALEEFIFVALGSEQDVEKACIKCGIDHLAFCVLNRAHLAKTGTPVEDY